MHLSLIVCAYNMTRELPRTIQSLSRSYQLGVADLDYEIIVVDNGSVEPVKAEPLKRLAENLQVIRVDKAEISPASAINEAVSGARGQVIGLCIDGARMASPGLLREAVAAHRADAGRVIGTVGFHLGPDQQIRSVEEGYTAAVEDALLASVPWQRDGYRLFSCAVPAGSSRNGFFHPISESNATFMDRRLWEDLGGLDTRFTSPGGGLVNLDFWTRAVAASGNQPWIILGEATFHQIHGGAATNGTGEARAAMNAEYQALLGTPYEVPEYEARYIGQMSPALAKQFGDLTAPQWRIAHSAAGRPFAPALATDAMDAIQGGTLKTRYRGRRFAKNPFDIVLYLQLLARLKPRTIIEVGTSEGGSAAWFRDQCRTLGINCRVITMDITPPPQDVLGVRFFEVDALRPEATFPAAEIEAAPHPWLVIEDSAHLFESTAAVMNFFHRRLKSGDYLVVEDGVVTDLSGPHYAHYKDGPNRAVQRFLRQHAEQYRIDTDLCDFFGHNVTYCPNAWLERL